MTVDEPVEQRVGEALDADGGDGDVTTVLPWWRNPFNIAAIAIAIAVLAGVTGWSVGRNSVQPDPNDADVGFLQEMRWHHEQAVQMALMYLDAGTDNAGLRTVAREIATGQSLEMGLMIQMLRDFGKPEANEDGEAMAWMGHAMPIEEMPGLATDEQLSELNEATGSDADQLFAELMIAHHEGGIEMSQEAVERVNVDSVRDLAQSMIVGQQGEITEMRSLAAGTS